MKSLRQQNTQKNWEKKLKNIRSSAQVWIGGVNESDGGAARSYSGDSGGMSWWFHSGGLGYGVFASTCLADLLASRREAYFRLQLFGINS